MQFQTLYKSVVVTHTIPFGGMWVPQFLSGHPGALLGEDNKNAKHSLLKLPNAKIHP